MMHLVIWNLYIQSFNCNKFKIRGPNYKGLYWSFVNEYLVSKHLSFLRVYDNNTKLSKSGVPWLVIDLFSLKKKSNSYMNQKIPCSGWSLQDIQNTVSVSVRVLRKEINDSIRTWLATNMRSSFENLSVIFPHYIMIE